MGLDIEVFCGHRKGRKDMEEVMEGRGSGILRCAKHREELHRAYQDRTSTYRHTAHLAGNIERGWTRHHNHRVATT